MPQKPVQGKKAEKVKVEDKKNGGNGYKPGKIYFTDDPDAAFERNITDLGNAERLNNLYGTLLRYNYDRGMWIVWDGKRWVWDREKFIREYAQYTARNIYKEAREANNPEMTDALLKHAERSEQSARISAMINEMKCLVGVPIELDQLDQNQMLFNVNNCTIDLTTGEGRPHDVKDYITKIVPIDYEQEAQCPIWEKFLRDTTGGDTDLELFLQIMAGLCLTGDMADQLFFYLFGLGQNGKTTFTEIILQLLGEYGMRVNSEMFMLAEKKNGSAGGATESLANIQGKRLIVSSEVPEGRKLNTSLLKDLTGGGETINARRLYEHDVEFKPVCKIIMFGNYRPSVSESTLALWRRLKLVPFKHTVSDADRDQYLGEKLTAELPGILAWAVQGCLIWQTVRFLDEPAAITTATREYQGDEDLLADFLTDKCELGADLSTDQKSMKKAYIDWCNENAIGKPMGPKKFVTRLEEKHCRKAPIKNVRCWIGVTLKK